MKILVTGGAGYIGSHACKVLARRGFEPIVFDNLSRGNRWAVKWGPLELGDVANSVRLRTILEQYRPAALMHFAAFAYVGESVEDPLLYYQNNVAASAALLQTLLSFETIPVVFSSTCATYGAPETIPISEDHPQRPVNPYGYSKLVVERMLADLDAASCSLNLANARGYSVKEVIATAERVSGRRIRVNTTPRRLGDPAVLIGAFDRAQATLGWKPARSDLQIQIRDAWNWMRGAVRPAIALT
jgi:UDP-glucose 4-epimerase